MISLIVAYDKKGVIGNGPDIPWHLPTDFAYFKSVTQGHPVIMGRTTFESIGRPLPNRHNIVVTRKDDYSADGIDIASSVEEAIELAKRNNENEEIFIIGGTQIYTHALENNLIDRAYVTHINADIEGDIFFPTEKIAGWIEISNKTYKSDKKNEYDMTMVIHQKHYVVDGNELADKKEKELKTKFLDIANPRLDIIIVGGNGATKTYVTKKRELAERVGVTFVEHSFNTSVSQDELISKIKEIKNETDGIVVQLPLPEHIDTETVCSYIPSNLDPDLLNKTTIDSFYDGSSKIFPPVVAAIDMMHDEYHLNFHNKKVLVIGKGKLVGSPAIAYMKHKGAHVTAVDKHDKDFTEIAQDSDIIVSGAGVSDLVTPEMIREGVILFDGGTSGSSGSIRGDIDWSCAGKSRFFSRSPGGIGPLTVVSLFENLYKLMEDK